MANVVHTYKCLEITQYLFANIIDIDITETINFVVYSVSAHIRSNWKDIQLFLSKHCTWCEDNSILKTTSSTLASSGLKIMPKANNPITVSVFFFQIIQIL